MEPLTPAHQALKLTGGDAIRVSANEKDKILQCTKNWSRSVALDSFYTLHVMQQPINEDRRTIASPQLSSLQTRNGGPHILSQKQTPLPKGIELHTTSPNVTPRETPSGCGARCPTTTTQHLPRPVACSHISRPRAPVPQRNPSALHGGPFPSIGSSQPPQVRRGRRVMPVARGPQPTSVEPTRLTNGKKIKAVETLHTQSEEAQRDHHAFTGPSKSALRQRRTQQVRRRHSTNEGEQIKTTVGNDDSWMKGLTYSTIIDSPKGSFKTIDCEGPYKRRPRTRRSNNHENRQGANYSSASKWSSLLVALRNLFL